MADKPAALIFSCLNASSSAGPTSGRYFTYQLIAYGIDVRSHSYLSSRAVTAISLLRRVKHSAV